MKDKNQNDSVETLLKIAGKRVVPNEQLKKEVYENVYSVWKQQSKPSFYHNKSFIVAASLFVFVGIYSFDLFSTKNYNDINLQISKKIVLSGQIQISRDQKKWSLLKTDSILKAGEYIHTNSSNRILVELNNGNTFRLDENSLIKLTSEDKIELIRGQIYVESNEKNINNQLLIDTKLGSIKHVGTQYNVELKPDLINISVRKGKVIVYKKDLTKEIEKGYTLSINNKGDYNQSLINSYDSKWLWTQNITKQYNIQDKTIFQYLKWVIWNSDKSKDQSSNIKLSGSIKGLTPLESLEVILSTTDFSYDISQSAIHISD